jgi:hypothetical protein
MEDLGVMVLLNTKRKMMLVKLFLNRIDLCWKEMSFLLISLKKDLLLREWMVIILQEDFHQEEVSEEDLEDVEEDLEDVVEDLEEEVEASEDVVEGLEEEAEVSEEEVEASEEEVEVSEEDLEDVVDSEEGDEVLEEKDMEELEVNLRH